MEEICMICCDKKKLKVRYKVNKKVNELYDLILKYNDCFDMNERTKLKSSLNSFEKSICEECRHKFLSVISPHRIASCRKLCHNYKQYGGKKAYWRGIWKRITGKRN